MSTEAQRTCPSCGNELSGAMEFCPVCMLRQGLAEGVESGESSASADMVRPTTPEVVVQRFEHYELLTGEDGKPVELGRGSMGVTYKAFDVELHCPVTVKVISERYLGDESARLSFLREALRSSFLAGLSTDRARAGALHQQMNFSTRRSVGLVIARYSSSRRSVKTSCSRP